jgi:hypothetical protein
MAVPADIDDFKPFNDSRVLDRKRMMSRASYKAFNAVAKKFLEHLLRLFPDDPTLRFILQEYTKVSSDRAAYKQPAAAFFREIRKKVPLSNYGPPKPGAPAYGGRAEVEYADMLMEKDERALEEPVPVAVLRGIRLPAKWKTMDAEMRSDVWKYVERLVRLASQAVFSGSSALDEMNDLSRAALKAVIAGKTEPADMVADPAVAAAACTFVERAQK